MLRLGKIFRQQWREILETANEYSIHSDHPAKIMATPNKLIYWHEDGLLLGFWHAVVKRDPHTEDVELIRGKDPKARSEIESYRFLDTLLDLTNKRVQGVTTDEEQAPLKSGDR